MRSEESRLSADLLKARDIASGLALDVDRSRREAEAAGRAAASKTKAAAERAAAVDALRIKLADLAAEAASEMSSSTALSSAEEAELVALSKASDALKLRVPLAARDMQVGGWVGEGRGERARAPRASSTCRWVVGHEHAPWFRTTHPLPHRTLFFRRPPRTACRRSRRCWGRTCACASRSSRARSLASAPPPPPRPSHPRGSGATSCEPPSPSWRRRSGPRPPRRRARPSLSPRRRGWLRRP